MDNICKICGKDLIEEKALHKHLRSHKISIEKYYDTHYPKKDLLTQAKIKYKNRAQYEAADFTDRTNLSLWFKSQREKGSEYAKKLLINRIKEKKLHTAPCQVELKSLLIPSIIYYDKYVGGYNALCDELKLLSKYPDSSLVEVDFTPYKVQIDSREQLPLTFPHSYVEKLDYGDYKMFNGGNSVIFERKSLADFIGTLSGGYERFRNEFDRAKSNPFIIIVEEPLEEIYRLKERSKFYRQSSITPEFIFHNMRDAITDYPQVQFLFVDHRSECQRVMDKIFKSKGQWEKVDLQLAYDLRKL